MASEEISADYTAMTPKHHYKTYVPAAAYSYGGQKKLHDVMDECVADITKVLGSAA